MKKNSHINSSAPLISNKTEYLDQKSTTTFVAKTNESTISRYGQIVTWKSVRSKVNDHNLKASFVVNIKKIENEENPWKMNNLLKGKKEIQVVTKNIE